MKVLLSFVIALGFVSSQQTTKLISVADPRPLSAAILELEKAIKQPITYEDPSYSYSADVADRSDRFRHAWGVRVLLPKGGTLNFPFMPSEASDRSSTAKVRRLVNTFTQSYPDGAQFSVLDQDGVFHVIPRSSRLASGGVGPHASPLDVPLTVVIKDVNGLEALNTICAAIKAMTGTTVLMGAIDLNAFARTKVSISTDKETGRTLLTKVLQVAAPALSWQLLTGAGPEAAYYFNVHQVPTDRRRTFLFGANSRTSFSGYHASPGPAMPSPDPANHLFRFTDEGGVDGSHFDGAVKINLP